VQQQGFNLVTGMMRYRNRLPMGNLAQETIACHACRIL
jgi:hypothetical protein